MDTIVHADDFGITPEQSELILECSMAGGRGGLLNSTSAMVGSPWFPRCADMACPYIQDGTLKMGLHLNLVEGSCCADAREVPLLTDSEGMFSKGFAGLLAESVGPASQELQRQITIELAAQMERFLQEFPQMCNALRLDSHQHFHMIPVVFRAMLEAADATGCTIEYIRVPAEPLGPYLATPGVRAKIPPVNAVKNVLLNMLWKASGAYYPQDLGKPAAFFGVALTGKMYEAMDPRLVDGMIAVAVERGTDLEMLFHPGGLSSTDDCLNPTLAGFTEFYLSSDRQREAEVLLPSRSSASLVG